MVSLNDQLEISTVLLFCGDILFLFIGSVAVVFGAYMSDNLPKSKFSIFTLAVTAATCGLILSFLYHCIIGNAIKHCMENHAYNNAKNDSENSDDVKGYGNVQVRLSLVM